MTIHSEGTQKVLQTLENLNFQGSITYLADDAKTAQQAADGLGCKVDQIAKSIVFRLQDQQTPLLVIASGRNRINEKHVGHLLNDTLESVDAKFVKEETGFVIGGVSPVGHTNSITTIIDEDLFQYETIWAAAGHPKAVFQLTPDQLVTLTKGQVMQVT